MLPKFITGQNLLILEQAKKYLLKDLVSLIAEKTNFTGEIIWDQTKPDGQPRRCLDITRAKNILDFEAKTSLSDGLDMTIEWYRSNIKGE
ncbi:hypothetical protein [Neobacillus sp. SuZ13]|uniref:hypothetical protein n=1 Tax=Neobacillus sp. SuZ13 TaxID=3047875 RepID=UPI0024C01239|nr:hypothetical protein [Neobacillus sp. SuZ13]WHY69732.1 hypothetical protein QNH17_14325 [Neobacillus sp. SuZ13]